MVALDEGFDRPQWKVLHSKYGAIPTRLLPELHERILEDGILFFISQNKSLPKNQQWKSSRKSWEGLTLGGLKRSDYKVFVMEEVRRELDSGREITLIINHGSIVAKSPSLSSLQNLGVRVFSDSNKRSF